MNRYKKATYTDQRKIEEILRGVLIKHEPTGLWTYKEGWSDRKVATSVNPEYGPGVAKTVRESVFGLIFRAHNFSPESLKWNQLSDRLERLERIVKEHEIRLDRQSEKIMDF